MLALEFTGTAGSARNAPMLLEGKDFSDDDVAEKICLGIALATVNAIRKAEITEIASLATSHRRHLGIQNEATYLGTDERSSQYIFDWHATLRIRDPIISHYDDWQAARGGHALFLVFGVRLIFTARPRTVQPKRVERPCTRVWRRRSYRGLTVLITTDRSLSADGCQDWHALCYLRLRQWQTIAMIFKEEETEMKKFKNIIAVSAFSLMVLALPAIASAQWGNNG